MKALFSHIAMICAIWMAAFPAWALPSASLIVHNGFPGENRVYLDGHFEGMIRAGSERAYALEPGVHSVRVLRPGGYEMVDTRVHLRIGRATNVHVIAPLSQLLLTNQGEAAIRVDLDPGTEVWIGGGQSTLMTVPAGPMNLTTSVRTRRGEIEIEQRSIWIEPGVTARTQFRLFGAVERSLVVTNAHTRAIRVLVGGRDRGRLESGRSMRLELALSEAKIQLVEIGGVVAYTGTVNLRTNQETRVILEKRHDIHVVRRSQTASGGLSFAHIERAPIRGGLWFRW